MWNLAVFSLVLLSFVLGTCEFIMIGIVPDISETLGVPLTQAGMLISWFALAYAAGTPVLSLWGSRFSRYRFLSSSEIWRPFSARPMRRCWRTGSFWPCSRGR